jgi:two-component system response regulator FixJ
LPVIFITGHADVQLAVEAMKAGAVDFIEKPFQADVILRSVRTALSAGEEAQSRQAETKMWQERLCQLTPREREVLEHLVAGKTHKVAARELGISYRTVEVHRAHIMEKLKANGISDLVRIVLKAPQPFLSQSASGACLASG